VIVSLAAYPLQFHLRGAVVDGCAIGSVHTLAEFRRRGLAAELLGWVERERQQRGERLSLLYSDISCGYYARLGYRECPAWEAAPAAADASVAQAAESHHDSSGSKYRLSACDPQAELDALMRCYEACHGRLPLAVARPRGYWLYTLAKQPHDEFFWLGDDRGERRGYVRLTPRGDELRIADFALGADDRRWQEMLLRRVHRTAVERGRFVAGWLPDWPASRALFELRARRREVTMVKPLDPGVALDDEALGAAHCFCEIDHV
jgi:predicted acetyltransferase